MKIALEKCNKNLSLTPVKNPEYLLPLYRYIYLKAPKYVLEGFTFSKCVFTQSRGIIIVVFIKATIAEAGINSFTGIASLSFNL